MYLTRVRKEIDNCNFPDWVNAQNWKVITRGGLRPRMTSQGSTANMQQRVSFPDRKSFILGVSTGADVSIFSYFQKDIVTGACQVVLFFSPSPPNHLKLMTNRSG